MATEALNGGSIALNSSSEGRHFIRINRAIAQKRFGNKPDMKEELDFLERNGDLEEPRIAAGVAALRGDRAAMFAALRECLGKTISRRQLVEFPVFEDYQDDPEFQKLVMDGRDS